MSAPTKFRDVPAAPWLVFRQRKFSGKGRIIFAKTRTPPEQAPGATPRVAPGPIIAAALKAAGLVQS
jgi:hypothetical protein